MALSWNEIKRRAIEFQREWDGVVKENAETQSFYNGFFDVFGISRRRVAAFEAPVKKLGDKRGRIDLFWKGVLLVEQKSRGRDLQSAYTQALDYFPNLKEEELPRYILVSDFENIELYDLETKEENKFKLKDFHKHIHLFGFIAGYEKKEYKDLEPVNIKASELMGALYDRLKEAGYADHDLEQFLVRLLFCLFADDTGIFERDIFKYYIEEHTKEDGSDVGMQITSIFQTLNTAESTRQNTTDEDLARFPYINGELFAGHINIPHFDKPMRDALLKCCYFDWSNISPAIFGSLFQSVADSDKRRSLGEHYTTERNILKTITPLFLDDLQAEFKKVKTNKKKLEEFHNKLASLSFFDPACGCGNFLVISYREIRLLELEVLKVLHKDEQQLLDVSHISKVDVDRFYGIEIEEFPAKIAEVALWLMDHQMNIAISEAFGRYYARIPLKKQAKIVQGNALRLDWKEVVAPENLTYILGNPPFIGSKFLSAEQREEMSSIFHKVKGAGVMDYVSAWYIKAADYIQDTKIKVAFVSTNSISQGEQAGILWGEMFHNYHIKIHFAHRTFAWDSEARGKAHVHVVIIGFGAFDTNIKQLYDYENVKAEAHEVKVKNINPYLMEGKDIVVLKRGNPICDVPPMNFGNMPLDGGNLLLSDEERKELIQNNKQINEYIKPLISAREFLNGGTKWCLWLENISPTDLKSMPLVMERVQKVKEFREKSIAPTTKAISNIPTLFRDRNNPETFLVVPRVSSERRKYVPIGFFDKKSIAGDTCMIIPNSTIYHFGVLTSLMHMTWMKYVCGRLESRYRYSKDIVYNNFPWPSSPSEAKVKKVEEAAKAVLEARKAFPDSSLADLYDPNTMPPKLVKAHTALDKAVDACYGKTTFPDERTRIEFLFDLYDQYTQPLTEGKK